MATATLLLPERARLAGAALSPGLARALARAERQQHSAGEQAQLRRHFQLDSQLWPVAALTRQLDAADAGQQLWLRADPALVASDGQFGARLMGYGAALDLDQQDLEQLLPEVAALFAEHGIELLAPVPSRWYLRLPETLQLPEFVDPADALGADLFDNMPQGPEGRLWRALMTELQVLLHQHPWNQQRSASGKAAINSLWIWGGGRLPQTVNARYSRIRSHDSLLLALAAAAGIADVPGDERNVAALVDLRQLRSAEQFDNEVMQPLLAELARADLQQLTLDFQDGVVFQLQPKQRWRFWRGALERLDG